jgi:hypothetical protein
MAHVPLGYYVEKIAVPVLFGSFRLICKTLSIFIEHGCSSVSENEDDGYNLCSDISPEARSMAQGPLEAIQYDYDIKYDDKESFF